MMWIDAAGSEQEQQWRSRYRARKFGIASISSIASSLLLLLLAPQTPNPNPKPGPEPVVDPIMASLFNEKSPFGAGRASNYTLPSVSLEPTNMRFAAQSTEELFDEGDGMPTPVVAPPPRSGNNLNTLQGVFVPTILNIFGVVTFLRMGWMTGECGLLITLGIIFVGELTVTLTALSISAIATNGTMRGGGAYCTSSSSCVPSSGGTGDDRTLRAPHRD